MIGYTATLCEMLYYIWLIALVSVGSFNHNWGLYISDLKPNYVSLNKDLFLSEAF